MLQLPRWVPQHLPHGRRHGVNPRLRSRYMHSRRARTSQLVRHHIVSMLLLQDLFIDFVALLGSKLLLQRRLGWTSSNMWWASSTRIISVTPVPTHWAKLKNHLFITSIKVRTQWVCFFLYMRFNTSHRLLPLRFNLLFSAGVCRAYCHKIIKLSGALQEFAAEKEVICNVHGKLQGIPFPTQTSHNRTTFVPQFNPNSHQQACARNILTLVTTPAPPRSPKEHILWAKWPGPRDSGNSLLSWITWNKGELSCSVFLSVSFNYDKLLCRTGRHFQVDIYGTGPHFADIRDTAVRRGIPVSYDKCAVLWVCR